MATNTFIDISMITRRALVVLENQLTFGKNVNRQYSDQFARTGAKIGDTVNIRKPARFIGRTGATLSPENYTESSVPLTLSPQFGVDLEMSTRNATLDFDDYSQRFIEPAVATIANKIDYDGMQLYKDVYNAVGTPGTVPNAFLTYLNAGVKLDNSAAPKAPMRNMVINPRMQAVAVDTFKGLFQSSEKIAEQYEQGAMGMGLGFNWYMDQNTATHTVGNLGGAGEMNGATLDGATQIVTDGWSNSITNLLNEGDIITIEGVYAVNPQNRQSTGELQQFVVTAAVNSDGAGNATIPVSPAIIASGAFQTVNALPADGADITPLGAADTVTPQGLAFHRDAFTLAMVDLELPTGGVIKADRVSSKKLGLSIRAIEFYDGVNDRFVTRLDVMYGWACIRPELACRICS